MYWTRSEALSLAALKCTQCHGLGLKTTKRGSSHPCNCVLRSIFRTCYNRFRLLIRKEKRFSRVSLEFSPRGGRRITWGRKEEEYTADFLLVVRRTLSEEQYRLFSYHYLLGADWKLCTRRLGLDRGEFFHSVYRIQQLLGRTFRDLRPYPLFPLEDYFENSRPHPEDPLSRIGSQSPAVIPIRENLRRVIPPLRRVA